MIHAFLFAALSLAGTPAYADLGAGREAIDADADYFNQLQPLEMAAKTGLPLPPGDLAHQRAVCRERYRSGVHEFTLEEQKALGAAAAAIDAAVTADYPLYASTPWRFLKMARNIEGGMPHTQGPFIVLSDDVARSIADDYAHKDENAPPSRWIVSLLLHEKMHVVQRQNPAVFDDLYINHWGFIKAKRIDGCRWLQEHRLANPDGPDCCWVFPLKEAGKTTYVWPLVTLSDGSGPKRMPADFRMLAIHVAPSGDGYKVETAADGKPLSDDLEGVAAYRQAMPGTTNNYHPNETLASLFADMIVADHFSRASSARPRNTNFRMLRGWCREHLRPVSRRI